MTTTKNHSLLYVFLLATIGLAFFFILFAFPTNSHAQQLETTQINGTVPQDEYDTIFHIQWGGGSLYQLKARLATHGCMLDIVWVYDNEQWYPYSQYNVPHSLQQEFLTRYEDNIPAGTLYVTCYDLCTFKYTESALDQMEEELREKLERLQSSTLRQCRTTEQLRAGYRDTNPKKNAQCTQDWHQFTKNNVFPILPRLGKVCIYRLDVDYNSQGTYGPMNTFFFRENVWYSSYLEPDIAVETNKNDIFSSEQEKRDTRLGTEIHEVCHNHQEWMAAQNISRYSLLPEYHQQMQYNNPAMQALIDIVGYTVEYNENRHFKYSWHLPEDSIFNRIYSVNPRELGAELCSFYIFQKHKHNNWDFSEFLTPEIVEWLETYIYVLSDPE